MKIYIFLSKCCCFSEFALCVVVFGAASFLSYLTLFANVNVVFAGPSPVKVLLDC